MQFISHLSTATNSERIVSDLTQEASGPFDLGFLFTSSLSKTTVQEIALLLRKKISVKTLLGCTCAGIIGSQSEIEEAPAASLILAKLPGVNIHPFHLPQEKLEELQTPEEWYDFFGVYPTENPTFLTLPDPFMFDMTYFLDSLNKHYPNRPIIGGLASGAGQAQENDLTLDSQHYDQGLIGVVLTGDVRIETVVSQGCRPFGETYIVTKADGNVIHELAGRPLLDVLQELLHKAPARDQLLAQEAIFVGIAMDEYRYPYKRGDFLIRGLVGLDRNTGAGAIADHIHAGQTVQFHLRDAQAATEDLNELLTAQQGREKKEKPKGALVFSCNGRGFNLFRQKDHDIKIIQDHVGPIPAAGFFCAGEIGPVGKSNYLHGFTNSMALFYPLSETSAPSK